MSRVIPIQSHISGTVRTTADCIVIEQQQPGSSVVLRATTLNRQIVIEDGDFAGTYEPLGFFRKDLSAEDNLDTGTTEIDAVLDPAYVTEDDIRAGRWDAAKWTMFRVNYKAPEDGVIHLGNGKLGEINWGVQRFTAELLDLMQGTKTGIGNLNSALCIHRFAASQGGPGLGNGCTLDPAPFTVTGTIDSVDSDLYGIHDSARGEADGYFSNGEMEITSGAMQGMRFPVRAFVGGFWVLFEALPYEPEEGTTYSMVRGCNKTLDACVDVFDNVLDRLASDYTQGRDAAMQVGRQS